MRIERVDPADAALVRACHAVHEAAAAVDDPLWSPPLSLAMYSAYVRHDWPGDPAETWYVPADRPAPPGPAGTGGPVAGTCYLQLPDLEDGDRAFMVLTVHPAHRRRGVGRALLRHAARRAAEDSRHFLDAVVVERSDGQA